MSRELDINVAKAMGWRESMNLWISSDGTLGRDNPAYYSTDFSVLSEMLEWLWDKGWLDIYGDPGHITAAIILHDGRQFAVTKPRFLYAVSSLLLLVSRKLK